jgi:predicted ferric reductase
LDKKIIDVIHYHAPHTNALHSTNNCTSPYRSKAGQFALLLLPLQASHMFRHFSTTAAGS